MCVVCWEAQISAVSVPCGHAVACWECLVKVRQMRQVSRSLSLSRARARYLALNVCVYVCVCVVCQTAVQSGCPLCRGQIREVRRLTPERGREMEIERDRERQMKTEREQGASSKQRRPQMFAEA